MNIMFACLGFCVQALVALLSVQYLVVFLDSISSNAQGVREKNCKLEKF